MLTAGTRIERDVEKDNKPVSVSVVTLLVDPLQSEALTLASTEGKIQLALRNPLDKTMPPTPGIKPAILLGQSAAPACGGRRESRRARRRCPRRWRRPCVARAGSRCRRLKSFVATSARTEVVR